MITVRNLIQQYRHYHPDGHFFDRDTLKNFGESIGRMRINGKGVVLTRCGENRICYELQAEQHIPQFGRRLKFYYFDEDDYSVIVPGNDATTTAWTGGYNDAILNI